MIGKNGEPDEITLPITAEGRQGFLNERKKKLQKRELQLIDDDNADYMMSNHFICIRYRLVQLSNPFQLQILNYFFSPQFISKFA